MAFKLVVAALILCIGLVSSRPVEDSELVAKPLVHKVEKRSSAVYLGDLVADETGIINSDQDFPSSSCKALYDDGYTTSSGKYNINPGTGVITVFCDMSLQSGGWTVIQRRINGDVDFDESWKNYQIGFGDFDGNFWLGLEKIKAITDCETNELYIGLESLDATPLYRKAEYSSITLKDEANFYELDIGTYSGNAGDSFATHDGVKFSTHDKDNDNSVGSDCSGTYNSGWWYKNCHSAHLNGIYYATAGAQPDGHGIIWEGWLGTDTPLKTVVIAVRPA